jgi:hypothetical protein
VQLALVYSPVQDLPGPLAFYQEGFGLEVVWRMGECIALGMPGTATQLWIDAYDPDGPRGADAVFAVPSVDAFWEEHRHHARFV